MLVGWQGEFLVGGRKVEPQLAFVVLLELFFGFVGCKEGVGQDGPHNWSNTTRCVQIFLWFWRHPFFRPYLVRLYNVQRKRAARSLPPAICPTSAVLINTRACALHETETQPLQV